MMVAGVVTPSFAQGARVEGLLRTMSLEDKVGQLFVVAVAGDQVDTDDPADVATNQRNYGLDNAEQVIDTFRPGGVVYFRGEMNNLKDPVQIAGLSNGIQRVAADQPHAIPMLVATDQEPGGYVIRAPGTQLPTNMALAASPQAGDDVAAAAEIIGGELGAMGINQNFAPVVDVNSNPANPIIHIRSFGDDPDQVATLAAAQVTTYQDDAGIVATAKHFPGHGDTDTDSHTGLPVIDRSREQIEQVDLPPFEAAIDADVGAIMTAHITVPALDPSGDPATLSNPIITGMLREQLGYDGVVITDALNMAGVREKYTDAEVPVLALKAGADQLLMPPNLQVARDAVLAAVRHGELTEERIDESVARILDLKERFGLFDAPFVDEVAAPALVGSAVNRDRAKEITDRTVTLLKNDDEQLPLSGQERRILVTGWGETTTRTLGEALASHGATASVHTTGAAPDPNAIRAAVTLALDNDVVVVSTRSLGDKENESQRDLISALMATGKPVIAVAMLTPYDIAHATDVPTYLATYSYSPVSVEALADVIYGDVNPTGRLPVSIPSSTDPNAELYPRGHHLTY